MKILLTLDYELFLGSRTGSVEHCLIEPMEHLQKAVDTVGAKFTIFVDATYLLRARQLSIGHKQLTADVEQITNHIKQLDAAGHDVQLHIHPHWAYSTYDDGEWRLDHNHYKLCDLEPETACQLTAQAKALLDETIGHSTRAFRAGGFSAQPTSLLRQVFERNALVADSTVCPGTSYNSNQQRYDYTKVSTKSDIYQFGDDICQPQSNGPFIEVPISMYEVSPIFHWRLAFNRVADRLVKLPNHHTYGDGISVKTAGESIVARLTSRQNCQATIDGFKIAFLDDALRSAKLMGKNVFTVLGHPKLATPYSVERLATFVKHAADIGDTFTTISQLIDKQ